MRVSHSRRKDQVVNDPQPAAKPDRQYVIVKPAVGWSQLAESISTQVQNPGSKKCCVLVILLSDFSQKGPHSNNNATPPHPLTYLSSQDNYRNNKISR